MKNLFFEMSVLGLLAFPILVGCSKSMSAIDLQQAQIGFDEALQLELSGNSDEAMAAMDKAIGTGGLNPDQLADGYLLRSRCRARAGDLEGAAADLESANRGAPDVARWHWTRSVLFEKQKKPAEAKAELAKARKHDPLRKIP
jgi:tetratricopeptide (TPR) repeat protein